MPEFILDLGSSETAAQYRQLDSFTQGYIGAMFFTDEEQLCEESGRDMPSVAIDTATMESRFVDGDSPGFADLAPEALRRIITDCEAFQEQNGALLDAACGRDGYDDTRAGHDFWYTRNGHGVGYWDRQELQDNTAEYEELTAVMVAAGHDTAAWHAALVKRNELQSKSLGERLSAAARAFRGVDTYVGDDGRIYL